jgi:hypothetical protein
MLRNVEVLSHSTDGDLMLGLILTAIIQANVRHISEDPDLSRQYGPMGAIPPDELRRPISINALSASLGIPYETTRRHVNRLLQRGLCVKVGAQGVVTPASVIGSPAVLTAAAKQFGHLIHFLRQLKAIGFEVE